MIPICLGWVYVGSQTSHTGVRDALGQASHSTEQPFIGIRDRIGDDKRMRIHNGESFEMQPLGAHTFPRRLGIEGDAIEPGPIHNYARLWTHMNVAQAFVMAFQHMMTRLEDNRNPLISIKGEPWAYEDYEANLIGSARQMMEFIDVKRDIEDVTLICESPPHVAERVALATLVSLFVQWGTTGSAIVVAYLYVLRVVLSCCGAAALTFFACYMSSSLPLIALLLSASAVSLVHTSFTAYPRLSSGFYSSCLPGSRNPIIPLPAPASFVVALPFFSTAPENFLLSCLRWVSSRSRASNSLTSLITAGATPVLYRREAE